MSQHSNWNCPRCGTPRKLNPAMLKEYLERGSVCRRCDMKKRKAAHMNKIKAEKKEC